MKNLICFFLLFSSSFGSYAQDSKDLIISLGVGSLGSPAGRRFDTPTVGIGYALDMSYFMTQRHIIAFNYTSGNHKYTETYLRDWLPASMILPTSTVEFRIFSLLYKYRILSTERFNLALGTGLSLQTDVKLSPDYYKRDATTGMLVDYSYGFRSSGSTDLSFPFKVEISFNLSRHWAIGVESGIFLMPTVYPWAGAHFIPRISYIFR